MIKLKDLLKEAKIKYKKGKTYQKGNPSNWTVFKMEDNVHINIDVNKSAGWKTNTNYPDELVLMDAGKKRATFKFKSGNIDTQAKKMFALNDKTTWGETEGLTAKDYANIERLKMDMQNYTRG